MDSAKRFHLLVVGVGSIGERHLRCFQNTDRCDLSLCEVNADLRDSVADRYSIRQSYASLDEALQEIRADAAVVATPAPLHIPLALKLARQGAHLLIEKPLSTTWEGVDELCDVIANQELVAAVGYMHRAHPLNRAAKELIDAQRFGLPLQAVFTMGQDFGHYRPAYRETYFARRDQGGGAIQDAMTHPINLGEWLLGPVDRLVTDAAHQHLPGVDVEDTVHTLARHGKILASYALNQYQAPNEMTYCLVCERGTLRVDYAKSEYSWMTETDGQWHRQSVVRASRDALYVDQANHFLDACLGDATPLCSLNEGLQTLRVNLASLESANQRSWKDVEPR